ncbi:MAG: ornithine cyclodeaminase family protein [Gemmatimonadales bacterium]
MSLHIIDADRVRELLPMSECVDAMATAMTAVSDGRIATPPRIIMPLIDKSGYFGVMPGSSADPKVYGAKIVSLHPGNPAHGRPAIQGFVALFDHETGTPTALVDGAEITGIRTAAASGLATRLLAREDATTVGIFGTGVQAATHIEAMIAVRPVTEVRVWGRSEERARAFAEREAERLGVAIEATDAKSAAAADIVCTTTGSPEPIIMGGWVRPGTHLNLVGAHAPRTREADTALILKGRVYVDSLESTMNEGGDLLIPIAEGAITTEHIVGEIGNVVLGRIPGRQSDDEITIYNSLGVVGQDLVAAHRVLAKARGEIVR